MNSGPRLDIVKSYDFAHVTLEIARQMCSELLKKILLYVWFRQGVVPEQRV